MQFHIRKSTYVKCPWTVLTQFTLGSVIQQNSHSSLDQKQMYIKKIIDWQIEGSGLDVACVEIILKFRCNITQAQWNVPQKKNDWIKNESKSEWIKLRWIKDEMYHRKVTTEIPHRDVSSWNVVGWQGNTKNLKSPKITMFSANCEPQFPSHVRWHVQNTYMRVHVTNTVGTSILGVFLNQNEVQKLNKSVKNILNRRQSS